MQNYQVGSSRCRNNLVQILVDAQFAFQSVNHVAGYQTVVFLENQCRTFGVLDIGVLTIGIYNLECTKNEFIVVLQVHDACAIVDVRVGLRNRNL